MYAMEESAALSHNLRRLRDEHGFSQAEVAERAGISRVAYRSIEAGAATPRASTLSGLAEVLGVKIADLMTEVRPLRAVRFREKKMNSREQLLVRVARWLEGYAEVEDLLRERVPFRFEEASPRRGTKANIPKIAAAAREAIDLAPDEPIRDICGLLEDNGVKVYPATLASEGFFGLSVGAEDGGRAIVVNVWDRISVERWIFTAAHELGHLLLHLASYDASDSDPKPGEEKEADLFASHFLMPSEVFEREWNEARGLGLTERVLKLKLMFNVSYKTILYRVQETTSLGKHVWGRFQAEYRDRHGRTLTVKEEPAGLKASSFMTEAHSAHEPDRLSPNKFLGDRIQRLTRQAVEEEKITLGRAAEILGVSLIEMRKLAASWVD
jgi:Zn-dependent peptidase ImmA (M78 family)/DNA-binding XRE family transcriptional regulator